jgi:hypothetical protein
MNRRVLIISPKKELFDSFIKNTICRLGLPKEINYDFLEFKNHGEYEVSKFLDNVNSSSYSHFEVGIILFPLEENAYSYSNDQVRSLNNLLLSNGLKCMSIIIVGENGFLNNSSMRDLIKNYLEKV